MGNQLTKAEEQFMQVLWELKEATIKDIVEQLPEPKPAYNTVSTIIRILETKNIVSHRTKGRGYIYYPLIKKTDYTHQSLHKMVDGYFGGSFKSMVSFFIKNNHMDIKDLESILKEIDKQKN